MSGASNEFKITTAPGIDLFVRFQKAAGKPKGTVLVVHGAGEHCGRWDNLAAALNAAGWSFYAYDHRGHGRSTGRRVHVDSWADYINDLQKVYDEVKTHAGEGKLFVYGHSMGSLIVASWAAWRRPTVWGVILSAPAFRVVIPVPKAKIAAAKILSKIVPTLALANEIDPAALSRDAEIGRAYMKDPLVERKATVRWGASILGAIDELNARASEMDLPFLLVHGQADKIGAVGGSEEWFKKAVSADKTMKTYEGSYHEIHNELPETRTKLFADVIAWLEARK